MLVFVVTFILDTFFITIFILSKKCYNFSLLKEAFITIFWENPNLFQLYFVNINATLVQTALSERKFKRKVTVKIHSPTTVTQWWIPSR